MTAFARLGGELPLTETFRGGIVALGNFDGLHLGHQAVVDEAVRWARAEGRKAIVATFDPHPVRYFRPDAPPFRLSTLDQRARLFAEAGADAMYVFDFGDMLAKQPADLFVRDWLAGRLGAAGVVTGEDFTFGHARGGNVDLLARIGTASGIVARHVAPILDRGEVVSSSRIRKALGIGDCATAARLLTRPFAIEGVAQHGDKNGRKLGYPTANLDVGDYVRPHYGVYAVRGRLTDGRLLDGVANIGIRPMFDPPRELLEPHFFDFSGDLYGQTIEVEFHAFLRGEARFDSLDALVAQMDADSDRARSVLAAVPFQASVETGRSLP